MSEALAIRACDVDLDMAELRIATLKRRASHWRAVPVRLRAIAELDLAELEAVELPRGYGRDD